MWFTVSYFIQLKFLKFWFFFWIVRYLHFIWSREYIYTKCVPCIWDIFSVGWNSWLQFFYYYPFCTHQKLIMVKVVSRSCKTIFCTVHNIVYIVYWNMRWDREWDKRAARDNLRDTWGRHSLAFQISLIYILLSKFHNLHLCKKAAKSWPNNKSYRSWRCNLWHNIILKLIPSTKKHKK
jgi:hypothetical protein